ncbi:MAG: o-succinylbenzoate synthase [Candidatus Marinimicrobia bacterium]|nr:o-succinylbenzoate synthase [Candidatus Neomarinimicrobiota bacterium]
MIIRSLNIFPYSIPFTTPLKTTSRTYNQRSGFIIRLQTDDDTGYGEAAPLPGISLESIDDCRNCLNEFSKEVDQNTTTNSCDKWLSFVKSICQKSPAAQFGLETAILDAASQQAGLSLASYLSVNHATTVPVNGLFHEGYSPMQGVTVTKIKVHHKDFSQTIRLVEQLSHQLGADHKFRLDVNGGWNLSEAIQNCNQLESLPIDYIEQPLPPDHLNELAELRKRTNIPIAVDESLTSFESAQRIVEQKAADVFVIKPMISGGFSEVNDIVLLAEKHHIRCVLTSSLETAVGRLATLHLAAAHQITEPCGLDTGYLLSRNVTKFPQIMRGKVTVPDAPGLGIAHITLPGTAE